MVTLCDVCILYSLPQVLTKGAQPSQWWPARANEGTLEKGAHTHDTIYRNDFLYTKELAPQPTYRHSANPNTIASRGIGQSSFCFCFFPSRFEPHS